ncbi:hypothetical protein SERLA73DRAFT_141978 [Serpula lacrymans var. lacrymans S7.3]|uniref:DUF1264-domain-containing protein n=2 Tax=Serpula lacrymans var. lacrymans TaxID=341189 RepID=F8Q733_SERL3|nr:uncharacterized protein SERLADRAFT_397807 [Serpula lacrymans var. lacrymans S7.9]EGN95371.1 hypothetical protein SERLA73DRAFT_141978 [Serpula lacrymans var. lacrymans S7.3]EGO20905.1 hypothetical protein SERLADRAFT_397807 [Serpula lacrymans var. lacrymans S7.9]
MDTKTKQALYHSTAYDVAGESMMTFKPINAIHQHLCGFHVYAHDHTRHVEAHHFCTHRSKDLHQCIIYDSDDANARLIGIEYLVSEKVFKTLPEEEKRYWHSHKYEVASGTLQLESKPLVPGIVDDMAEQPAMLELYQTYGKTIHTWPFDTSPELPLGPPNLMMAYTQDGQVAADKLKAREERTGVSIEAKKKLRAGYLPPYERAEGADQWENSGKGISFNAKEVEIKK